MSSAEASRVAGAIQRTWSVIMPRGRVDVKRASSATVCRAPASRLPASHASLKLRRSALLRVQQASWGVSRVGDRPQTRRQKTSTKPTWWPQRDLPPGGPVPAIHFEGYCLPGLEGSPDRLFTAMLSKPTPKAGLKPSIQPLRASTASAFARRDSTSARGICHKRLPEHGVPPPMLLELWVARNWLLLE